MKTDSLQQLQIILEKNPIIHTATSEELVSSPDMVEKNYIKHALTHMSLGDTEVYEERLIRYITRNRRSFIGAVTGDYGLGKTSLLVYLWHQSTKANILAVPPFSWKSLDDLFLGVESWIAYSLGKQNSAAVASFKTICKKYEKRSIESLVDEFVREGMREQAAKSQVEKMRQNGTLKLDRRIKDLLNFCDDATLFLMEHGYQGLLVLTDELQESIQHMSPEQVFSYIFELADSIQDRNGNYGIMIGMPLNTKVQFQDVRSDVLDRLLNHKMFIDLSDIYDSQFAPALWGKYAEHFDFKSESAAIIDDYTLAALGQLTNSKRKDIGNGPRSVISAFKTIVDHYQQTGKPYDVFQLVEDILEKSIMMGENSRFVSTVNHQLELCKDNSAAAKLMRLLAAYPAGCSQATLTHWGFNDKQTMHQLTEWMGQTITESPSDGFKLIALQQSGVEQTSFFERAIKDFVRYYDPQGQTTRTHAVHAFNNILVEEMLTENDGCNWHCLFEQQTEQQIEFFVRGSGMFVSDIGGSFERSSDRYPNRHLRLMTVSDCNGEYKAGSPVSSPEPEYVTAGKFIFELGMDAGARSYTEKVSRSAYRFHFDLNSPIEEPLHVINRFVPSSQLTPMFLLGLLHRLTFQSDIPASEEADVDFIITVVKEALVSNLLSESMKDISGTERTVKNHGKHLLYEIFESMCVETYPDYRTIIKGRRWKEKIRRFETILQSERFPVAVKRGVDPIVGNYAGMGTKEKKDAAELFGYTGSIQPLQSLIDEYSSLVRVGDDGSLYLNVHPAEQACLDMIQLSEDTINDNGKICKAIAIEDLNDRLCKLGYTSEEVQTLYVLAASRKLFFYHPSKRKAYFKPLSIEEWQLTLRKMVEGIEGRVDELELHNIRLRLPLENWNRDIDELTNEEQYEQYSRLFLQETSKVNQQLSLAVNSCLQIVDDMLAKSARVLSDLSRSIRDAEQASHEHTLWSESLSRYNEELSDLQSGYQAIVVERNQVHRARPDDFAGDGAPQKFEAAMEIVNRLRRKWDEMKERRKQLESGVEQLLQWDFYFRNRERIERYFDRLQTLGLTHLIEAVKQQDLELEKEWRQGSPSADGYQSKLQVIEDEISLVLRKAREEFNKEKEHLQTELGRLGIQARLNQQFMEDRQSESLELLREEFEGRVNTRIEGWLDEIDQLIQNMTYMEKVKQINTGQIERRLGDLSSKLFKYQAEWCKDIPAGIKALAETAADLETVHNQTGRMLNKGQLEKDEQIVKDLIENDNLSLEELVIKYWETTDELELEKVLSKVIGLFKKNHIDIRIRLKK
ncbi:hypothetical protein [Paenibacillus lautus]|uniref:hypothetical protein n=1 Tax=Paenibacillus lautus TaxID=1401 RepID=UPI003D9AB262